MTDRARTGWDSSFSEFREAPPRQIREGLAAFIKDASPEQIRAWDDAIPPLQTEVDEVLVRDALAKEYSAILEYELPMEARRPDVILLVGAAVMVIELKGKVYPTQADLDQAAAYARDLRNYHRECAGREVIPVLVPARASGYQQLIGAVHVTGPDALDALVARITSAHPEPVINRGAFLSEDAYRPLPTLVEAARELLQSGTLRTINRAHAATGPALDTISKIVHQAAITKSRHLVLLTGVPGAGKTLVGLQTVHAKFLDDLAVDRGNGKPSAPAVFLSGNGPLVKVLQYEMRAVGDGKTFVRAVRDYIRTYSKGSTIPPEHVLVFDEAQRAFDADKMRKEHKNEHLCSEPEELIRFADRIPEWCVVLGLIGSGQEIYEGEEAGLDQWRIAVDNSHRLGDWTIHGPPEVASVFISNGKQFESQVALNLSTALRFHQARDLHTYTEKLLSDAPLVEIAPMAAQLNADGLHLRITRDLEAAKTYLRERYADDPKARFGLIASSRDRDLPAFGIPNDYPSTRLVKVGPWYGDDEDDYGGASCRLLHTCLTEFGTQGLELDAALLAWGTDLIQEDGRWSSKRAARHLKNAKVKNPHQLRLNTYRVLLTRGRDGTVIFVPPLGILDETYRYLRSAGVIAL